jgi:hypothetical protein
MSNASCRDKMFVVVNRIEAESPTYIKQPKAIFASEAEAWRWLLDNGLEEYDTVVQLWTTVES